MKHLLTFALTAATVLCATAQPYKFTFQPADRSDSVLYIGVHHRDVLQLVDSARRQGPADKATYSFSGNKKWPRGIYTLVAQDRKKGIADFCVDGSVKFSISGNADLSASSVKVTGSTANSQMFDYLNTLEAANKEMDDIRQRLKDPATKAQAEADQQALSDRMKDYDKTARHPKSPNVFFDLVNACETPDVPDDVEDKATYYRLHYWDPLFEGGEDAPIRNTALRSALFGSPQLFSKLNYFFYGVLYYADSDTIIKEIDRLADRIGNDTAFLRYVFDHIEPRYFRSTKNIGWDAVWCHLAETYYLAGRCPWASEGTLHNMDYNYKRIVKSIIGAHGENLCMIDTTQIDAPGHWVCSHNLPTKYVILWFWDPDCHHCQEQSDALKVLYDSLATAPDKRFEVFAVGYESDVPKWKRYVREHDFRWVNVGGPAVNVDYQEAYNVHGAPTMIILNERRDIIMNKAIPAKSLLGFLDQYEKSAARKAKTN